MYRWASRGGRRAQADVVVGADGLRSAVRASLGIPGEIRYAGYTAWRGIAPFRTAGLLAGETLGCGQRFGLVPIAGDRVYWYATDNVPEGGREESERAKVRLAGMFSRWHAPIPALIEATPAAAILRNDISDRDPVDRWGAGRVTLLGDAAHPMTPNLGQGGCQAIEDALVLARCLARRRPGRGVAAPLRGDADPADAVHRQRVTADWAGVSDGVAGLVPVARPGDPHDAGIDVIQKPGGNRRLRGAPRDDEIKS